MPNDLDQLVQQIPADQLDHLHQALNSIRSGMYQGKPLDTSAYDMDMVKRAWEPVHQRVLQRDQDVAPQEPSMSDKWAGLGRKAIAATTGPGTAIGQAGAYVQAHPLASALMGPVATEIVSGAAAKPAVDIPQLEAPGYAQAHPFMHGVAEGASGLTSPENVGLMVGMGAVPKTVAAWAGRAFTAQMAMGNVQQAKSLMAAVQRGDYHSAYQAAGEMAVTAPFTALGVLGSRLSPEENTAIRKWTGTTPKPPVEPQLSPSAAPTTTLTGGEVAMAPNTSKPLPTAPQGPPAASAIEPKIPSVTLKPSWVAKDEAFLAENAKYIARSNPYDVMKVPPAPGQGTNPFMPESPSMAAKIAADQASVVEGKALPQVAPKLPAPSTPAAETRISDIDAKLKELQPQARQPGVADQRDALMAERAKLTPPKTLTAIEKVDKAVRRAVNPDENPNTTSTSSERFADAQRVMQAHLQAGTLKPEDLRQRAAQYDSQAAQLDFHTGLEGFRGELDKLRGESQPQRVRLQNFDESGTPMKSEFNIVDSASSARRTVLRMLGGARLTYGRIYDAETGNVGRDYRKQPLTREESDFTMAQQAALQSKVSDFQTRKAVPTSDELADMEKHAEAIEAASGMKAVFAGKGGIGSIEPSRAAINEALGKGSASHQAIPTPEKIAETTQRFRDYATTLKTAADRAENISPIQQVAKPPKVVEPTPTTTPTEPRVASPEGIRGELLNRVEAHEAVMSDPYQWESKTATEQKRIQAEAKVFNLAADNPKVYASLPERIRTDIEDSVRASESAERRKEGGFLRVSVGSPEDITSFKGKLTDVAERLQMSLGSIGGHVLDMLTDYKSNRAWGEPEEVQGHFKASRRLTEDFLEHFDKSLKEAVPKAVRRIAITNWIQAGGDNAVLAAREKASSPRFAQGYRDAQTLTPFEKAAANGIRQSYDDVWERLHQAGVIGNFLDDYVNQLYKGKKTPMGVERLVQGVKSGGLQSNPGLAKQRFYDSYFAAEQAGMIPRNKDIGWLHSTYLDQAEKAIRSRTFVKAGTAALSGDGRPMFAPEGIPGKLVAPANRDPAVLIRAEIMPKDVSDYKLVNHPSMRAWQWMSTDPESGTPTLMHTDLRVHPDHYAQVKAMLEPSAIRSSPVGNAALKLSAGFKYVMFGMTGFHASVVTGHAIEHGVNPFRLKEINLAEPDQLLLASAGLQTHDYDAQETFGRGIEGTQLINSIQGVPGAAIGATIGGFMGGPLGAVVGGVSGAGLGHFNRMYSNWLFNDYIPKLKTNMALEALQRNRTRYAGKMTDGQIASLTADQANAAFGGLDYEKLGRSKTLQDVLKLGFIAPDFFEARSRFVGQAMRPGGREQATALIRGAAVMYVGARIMNQLGDGDPHWDRPFSVVYNGTEYTLRTIQSDVVHAVTDPRGFLYNRLNPVTVRTAIEALTGRDNQGFERGMMDQVKDFFQNTSQVAVQGYLKDPSLTVWDTLRTSMGLASHQYHTDAEQTALKFMMQDIPRGPQGAEEREHLQALHGIRRAFQAGDETKAGQLLDKAVDSGIISDADADKLDKNSQTEYLPQLVKRLQPEQAMEVFRRGTPAERDAIQDIVEGKVDAALDHAPDKVRQRLEKEADELFK